jgi:hypothetical protein
MKRLTLAIRGLGVGLLILGLVGIVGCDSKSAHKSVYERLHGVSEGMTYDEVVRIMGDPRQEGVAHDSAGLVTGKYTWEDSGGVAELYFEGDRLRSLEWYGWP